MAVHFHPIPPEVFPEKARPYIVRLNRELRDLFALEGVIAQPTQGTRSDASIVRRAETQVAADRITPSIISVVGSTFTGAESFVTISNHASLSNERRISVQSPLTGTDNGANSTFVLTAPTVTTAAAVVADGGVVTGSGGSRGLAGSTLTLTQVPSAAAVIGDNLIVRGDGGSRGLQGSSVSIADTGHLTPEITSAQDLGTTTALWRDLHLGRDAYVRDTSAAFDGILGFSSSPALTANRALTVNMENTDRGVVTAASTFATDNAVLRADGTGRGAQGGRMTEDDAGVVTMNNAFGAAFSFDPGGSITVTSGGLAATAPGTLSFTITGGDIWMEFAKNDNDAGNPATASFIYTHAGTFDATGRFMGWSLTDILGVNAFISQVCRFGKADEKFALYKDTNSRWQQVDGMVGGGFSYTDAGTTEPIT